MKSKKSTRGEAFGLQNEKPAKKGYAAPQLTTWGSVLELTNGPINGVVDMDFSGTGGA